MKKNEGRPPLQMLEKQRDVLHSSDYAKESVTAPTTHLFSNHEINVEGQTSPLSSSTAATGSISKVLFNPVKKPKDFFFAECVKAIKSNNSFAFQKFLEKGRIPVDTQDTKGCTLLHHAIKNSSTTIVSYLLNHKATIDIKNYRGNTPLHVIKREQVSLIKFFNLIKEAGGNIDAQNYEGNTLLHLLLKSLNDCTSSIVYLINNGVNINIQDNKGLTPLHVTLRKTHLRGNQDKSRMKITGLLLEKGANIYLPDRSNQTPLAVFKTLHGKKYDDIKHFFDESKISNIFNRDFTSISGQACVTNPIDDIFTAIEKGNVNEVKNLIDKKGFDANAQNDKQQTLLELAMIHDHKDIFVLLIDKKANYNIYTTYKETPLHYAARQGYDELISYFSSEHVAKNVTNHRGRTPLHCAIEGRHVKTIYALMGNNKDVNVDAIDSTGKTCLHLVLKKSRRRDTDTILNSKDGSSLSLVDALFPDRVVNSSVMERKDNNGKTPLHYAVQDSSDSSLDIMHALSSKFGNKVLKKIISEKDNKGWTALHYAVAFDPCGKKIDFLTENCKANIDERDNDGNTFLHLAVMDNIDGAYFDMLLKKGGHLDITNVNSEGTKRFYKYLNVRNNNDETVLISMLKNEKHHYHNLVMHIIELECIDLDAKDKDGYTALHCVIRRNLFTDRRAPQFESGKISQRLKIIMKLVEKGANIYVLDREGKTPYDYINGHRDANKMKELLDPRSGTNASTQLALKGRQSVERNLTISSSQEVERTKQPAISNNNSNPIVIQELSSVSSSQSASYVDRLLTEDNNSEKSVLGKRNTTREISEERPKKKLYTELVTTKGKPLKIPEFFRF